jgi:Cu+-exporting ATPase
MTTSVEQSDDEQVVDLAIIGMTCATCATRIERRLNKLPGVQAHVNYATENAHVTFTTGAYSIEDFLTTVENTGYKAIPPAPPASADDDPEALTEAEQANEDEVADLRMRFYMSLALAIPVVVLSMIPALQFSYWQWACFLLATPVVIVGAEPFHRAAWKNLKHGATTMDTLISMGTLAAYIWSVWAIFIGGAKGPNYSMTESFIPSFSTPTTAGMTPIYFEVAAAVPVFILAGRWFEAKAKKQSGAALRALLHLGAKDVSILRDGVEMRVPVQELAVGMNFVVRPGERIATDGVVVEGSSAIDESLITGESVPIEVAVGDPVTGATVNTDGHLVVRATRVGNDTRLAQIARLVNEAQSRQAPVQRLADRVSSVFVPTVIGISLVTLIAWLAVPGT